MPERAIKIAKRESCEIRYLLIFNGMMEGRNGALVEWRDILRSEMMEYPKPWKAF